MSQSDKEVRLARNKRDVRGKKEQYTGAIGAPRDEMVEIVARQDRFKVFKRRKRDNKAKIARNEHERSVQRKATHANMVDIATAAGARQGRGEEEEGLWGKSPGNIAGLRRCRRRGRACGRGRGHKGQQAKRALQWQNSHVKAPPVGVTCRRCLFIAIFRTI